MSIRLMINEEPLKLRDVEAFVFAAESGAEIEFSAGTWSRVQRSREHLLNHLEKGIPIYGVTTGFGDSCHRVISPQKSEELQSNLIAYLACGTGPSLPEAATRAAFLIRLKSLSMGYSGVSKELLTRMQLFIERRWTPVVPCEGSLGASGDLIPLAYLARAMQGEGLLHAPGGGTIAAKQVLEAAGVSPYRLQPKEGLAIVNGTSTMAGLSLLNLREARILSKLATLSSAWLCLALQGRTEAFGELVNEKTRCHPGQKEVAQEIRGFLAAENYRPLRGQDVAIRNRETERLIQDRYSLRCAPQILGPVVETIELATQWLEREINSVTDNPLIDDDGSLGMGGNFYGGYLSHGMDYLKISLANVADLLDRQLALLIDDKSNRGLPPNLADWDSIPEADRHLHHGLKGLHQAVSAITSGVMAKAIPNSIFSRSSESHNQDKVSLGMTAAVQCQSMNESLFSIQSMHLICLAQAIDLRQIKLEGDFSRQIYRAVREAVPFVNRDISLGDGINALAHRLKGLSL